MWTHALNITNGFGYRRSAFEPVFDLLIISELLAVSILSARSVFYVAGSNILFIVLIVALKPHTPALNMLLSSRMAYNALIQPISLQFVTAVIAFIWVRSVETTLKRANRAEEIAEMQQRELEQKTRLEQESDHLLSVLTRAANGDLSVRATIHSGDMLWKVGNGLNLLLVRVRRNRQTEIENQQLRAENAHLLQLIYERKMSLPADRDKA